MRKKGLILIIALLTIFSNMLVFADNSLPLPMDYIGTTPFSMYYYNGYFVFYYPEVSQSLEETFLIVADGKNMEVTLSPQKPVGYVKVDDSKNIMVYRDKERAELSAQFKDNFANYTIKQGEKSFYFYRQYNGSNAKPTDNELEQLYSKDAKTAKLIFGDYKANTGKTDIAIGKLKLLNKDGAVIEHIIYRSPYVDDKTQIKNTIEYIYKNELGITEILTLDNIPLVLTPYSEYAGYINKIQTLNTINLTPINNLKQINTTIITNTPITRELSSREIEINGIRDNYNVFNKSGSLMLPLSVFKKAGLFLEQKYRKEDLNLLTLYDTYTRVEMRVTDNRMFINKYLRYNVAPEIVGNEIYLPISVFDYFGYHTSQYNNRIVVNGGI